MKVCQRCQKPCESSPDGLCPDCRKALDEEKTTQVTKGGAPSPQREVKDLGARYRVRKVLGKGGMGVVYLAYDRELNMDVALKVILPEWAGDEKVIQLLKQEIRLARSLTHPHICRIYDLDFLEGQYCFSMQYLDGITLREALRKKGSIPWKEAQPILQGIGEALSYAHEKEIIHLDLKPANIMLDQAGCPYIMDFGIARSLREAEGSGEIRGTLRYMAPEQMKGEALTPQTDIYAFALMVCEILTGALPGKENPMERLEKSYDLPRPKGVPKRIWRWVLKALQPEPENRPPSIASFLKLLQPRNMALPLAGVGMLMLAIWLFIIFFFPSRPPPRPGILVVPFQGEKESWLALGIPQMIQSQIVRHGSFSLIRFPSHYVFSSISMDPLRIAQKLHADYVIQGAFQKEGEAYQVKISLWSIDKAKELSHLAFHAPEKTLPQKLPDAVNKLFMPLKRVSQKKKVSLPAASTVAWYTQGVSYLHRRLYGKATQAFLEALDGDQKYLEAWVGLAEATWKRGYGIKAQQYVEKIESLKGEVSQEEQWRIEALSSLIRGKKGVALSRYIALRRKFPDNLFYLQTLVELYLELGYKQRAHEEVHHYLQDHSEDPIARYLLVKVFLAQGQWEQGEREIQQLLTQEEEKGLESRDEMVLTLAELLWKQRKYGEAKTLLAELINRLDKDQEPYLYAKSQTLMAKLLMETGAYDESEKRYHEALTTINLLGDDRQKADLYIALGSLNLYRGRWDMASGYYTQAKELCEQQGLKGKGIDALIGLAIVPYLTRDYESAIVLAKEAFEKAKALKDTSRIAIAAYNIGTILLDQNDYKLAKSHYQNALTLFQRLGDPLGLAKVYLSLGNIAMEEGDLQTSFIHYQEALQLNQKIHNLSSQSTCLLNMAEIKRLLVDWDEAEAYARQSLEIRKNLGNPIAIGEILFKLWEIQVLKGAKEELESLEKQWMALSLPSKTRYPFKAVFQAWHRDTFALDKNLSEDFQIECLFVRLAKHHYRKEKGKMMPLLEKLRVMVAVNPEYRHLLEYFQEKM